MRLNPCSIPGSSRTAPTSRDLPGRRQDQRPPGQNKIGYEELRTALKEDLAKILGVDAVISGKIQREKPMSEGAAIALGVLIGFWGSTNKVNIDLTIHDGATGELFWKYTHQISGSVGSSSEQLVKSFTRKIARNFPTTSTR